MGVKTSTRIGISFRSKTLAAVRRAARYLFLSLMLRIRSAIARQIATLLAVFRRMATSSAAGSGPLSALPPELYALLDGPCVMYIATRNAALEPLSVLAFGLQSAGDDREVTVFVPATLSPLI